MRRVTSWRMLPAPLRKLIVLATGGAVLLVGIVMIVTPGPAMIVIPSGLAILSLEFKWAHRLLARCKTTATKAVETLRHKAKPLDPGQSPPRTP